MHQHVALGISRGLAASYHARRETPKRLSDLVERLKEAERPDRTQDHLSPETLPKTSGSRHAARRELDKYLDRLGAYLPNWFSEAVKWLRAPKRFIPRALVSVLLIAGSVFSFLPVLGLWMLPLGLIIISQDLAFLQRPLVSSFRWVEGRWQGLRSWWRA